MGAIRAMWNLMIGRRQTIEAQQEEVSRALAYQREQTKKHISDLGAEMRDLRGAEVRMMDAFVRLRADASRTKQGH